MNRSLTSDAEAMVGDSALPRDNGAFVFDEPWEGQAFGLAVALVDRLGLPWREFQQRLITAIAARPHGPYYENWAAALESLAIDFNLVSSDELDSHTGGPRTAAHHDHGDE
jgi:nitrile hydratase accessory protein